MAILLLCSAVLQGSPETIRSMADPASVPPDFEAILQQYTREGLRVLALAQGDASMVRLVHASGF